MFIFKSAFLFLLFCKSCVSVVGVRGSRGQGKFCSAGLAKSALSPPAWLILACVQELGGRNIRGQAPCPGPPAPAGGKQRRGGYCREMKGDVQEMARRAGQAGEGWLPLGLRSAPRKTDSPRPCCESCRVTLGSGVARSQCQGLRQRVGEGLKG